MRHATPAEIADHDRDLRKHEPNPRLDQRCAVAKLVGYCEGIANSGLLGEELEAKMRRNVAEVLVAFNMPSRTEREPA